MYVRVAIPEWGWRSPVERGSLMVEKIEKHEWLQDSA